MLPDHGEGRVDGLAQALTREEEVERTLSESTKPRELNSAPFLAQHLRKGSNAGTLTIDLGSGGGVFARRPDALHWRCAHWKRKTRGGPS